MIALKCNKCGGKLGVTKKHAAEKNSLLVGGCGHCSTTPVIGELELFSDGIWTNDGVWFAAN